MLVIDVPARDDYDEETSRFIAHDAFTVRLEHSLVSMSKWEAKYCIPFLDSKEKTDEQTLDYIVMMDLDETGFDPNLLTSENIAAINDYVSAKMTATVFSELPGAQPSRASSEFVTSEIIYYWMVALNIPFECQNWHINRLLTLIKVCNQKNQPAKKMSPKDLRSRQRALNAQRRAQLGTSG